VPKDIVVLDKLPLTAVGKPMKHLLQLQAARTVFHDALQDVPGPWELEVVNTGGSGLKTTLRLHCAPAAMAPARAQAETILSSFSTPFVIL
jgi:fatty-acyl-CoA synthase